MANETTPHNPNGGALLSSDLKKMLVIPVATMAAAFIVAWFTAQQSQSEIRFQTAANKEALAVNSAAIKANADAINQLVISMARYSEAQARIAEDMKLLQADQRNINHGNRGR